MPQALSHRFGAVLVLVFFLAGFLFIGSFASAATNLVQNGDLEIAAGSAPANWSTDSWGTLSAAFTYPTPGQAGNGARVVITGYSSGDAKWQHAPVAVTAGTIYQISDSYSSNAASEIDIEYKSSSGAFSYVVLASPASTGGAWATYSGQVTVPAGIVSMTVLHLLQSNGSLTIDNMSVTSGTTPPPPPPAKPVINSFTANPSIVFMGSSTTLSWAVTGATALTIDQGVGAVTGTSKVVSVSATTTYTLSASNAGGTTTAQVTVGIKSADIVPPPPPPTAPIINSFTANPSIVFMGSSTTLSWSVTGADNLFIDQGVGDVTGTSKIVTVSATTTYTLSASNSSGTTTAQVLVGIKSANNPPASGPPSCTLTATPASIQMGSSTTLSWTTANADSFIIDNGVGSVSPVSSGTLSVSPTTTTKYTAEPHGVGVNQKCSTTVTVVAPPPPPPPANLITNGNLEAGATNAPTAWSQSSWGTLTTKFTYPVTGKGGGKAAAVQITKFTEGAANWVFDHINSDSHSMYDFSEDYMATVPTEIDIEFHMADGSYQYAWLANVPAATSWQTFKAKVTVPNGAVSFSVLHILFKVGSLTIDNATLTKINDPFAGGMLTFVFDDGLKSQTTNAAPMLKTAGMKGTFAIITTEPASGDTNYMTWPQIKALATAGHEIANHSRSHPDLTTLNATQLQNEIKGAYNDLVAQGLAPKTFVYPVGAVNAAVETAVKNAGHIGARGSYYGQNTPHNDKYDLYDIRLDKTSKLADIQNFIAQAKADKRWIVFELHDVKTGGDEYAITPAFFQSVVNYAKSSGIQVVTLQQGMTLMQ